MILSLSFFPLNFNCRHRQPYLFLYTNPDMVSQYEATLFINLFATQYHASYYQLIKLE
jgi:hypothetical protein